VKEILENLNKVFENRIRLAVMSALMVNDSLDFNSFKLMLDVSDGNLATHMNVLEKSKYVTISKTFVRRKPLTTYSATATGKRAFGEHLEALEQLIKKNSVKKEI
jgi:DNA-binding PadR family transcriptional regulator